jgi:hypothetical protein
LIGGSSGYWNDTNIGILSFVSGRINNKTKYERTGVSISPFTLHPSHFDKQGCNPKGGYYA